MTTPQGGAPDNAPVRAARQIVHLGIEGIGKFKSAQDVAAECLRASGGDVDDAVERAIRLHLRYSATSGGAQGLGGLITLPAVLTAGLATSYVINARMVGTIAHLRGYELDSEEVRTVMLLTLLGSGGAMALQKAGVQVGNKALLAAVNKVPGKVLIEVNKKIGFRLITKAGEKGVINVTKLVPLVGAPIGASTDYAATRVIARYARVNFPPLPSGGAM